MLFDSTYYVRLIQDSGFRNFVAFCMQSFGIMSSDHRRRMETEAKAKVVANVCGAKFIQFLAALAVLPQLI